MENEGGAAAGMNDEDRPMNEAIAWTLRLPAGDAETWRAFSLWLSASPANLDAYERAAEADRLLVDWGSQDRAPATEDEADERAPARARWWVGGGLSVALAAAAAWFLLVPAAPDLYSVETLAGVRQSVTLPGGSRIDLNGVSKLTLDRDNPRYARLDSGEALFWVGTNKDAPFHVEAGDADIRNIGTIFDVRVEPGMVSVEVGEGAVRLDAGEQTIDLSAGERAQFSGRRVTRGRLEPATVGSWVDGQLSFSSATLGEVARDIERASGIEVTADPALEARRFSGNIMVDDDRDAFRRRLSAVLGVDVRLVGDRWVLAPSGR